MKQEKIKICPRISLFFRRFRIRYRKRLIQRLWVLHKDLSELLKMYNTVSFHEFFSLVAYAIKSTFICHKIQPSLK